DAITCCGYALVVWRTIPETRPPESTHHPRGGPGYRVVLRDRLAVAYCGINFSVMLAYGTIYTILPLAMAADGHGADQYGLVVALNGLAIVVLQPLLTPWPLGMEPAAHR